MVISFKVPILTKLKHYVLDRVAHFLGDFAEEEDESAADLTGREFA